MDWIVLAFFGVMGACLIVHQVRDALGTGVEGVVDDLFNLRIQERTESAETKARCALESDRFEANTYCGRCGSLAVHGWREPNPVEPEVIEVESEFDELKSFGGDVVCVVERGPYKRLSHKDERHFSVVRQCVCGHEWGQK